jgi:hypothetical protein
MVRVASNGHPHAPAQAARPVHYAAPHGDGVARAHASPPNYDEQLAQFFRQMRAAAALPPLMIAARLGADPAILSALENGDYLSLPPSQETARIVTAYGRMVGIDPNIALHRIQNLREAGGMPAAPMHGHPTTPNLASQNGHRGASTGGWLVPAQHAPSGQMPTTGRPGGPYNGPPNASTPAAPPPAPPALRTRPHHPAGLQSRSQSHSQMPAQPSYGREPSHGTPAAAVTSLPAINPLQPAERVVNPEGEMYRRRFMTPDQTLPVDDGVETKVRRHPARVALKYVTLPMIVAAGLWYTVQNPTTVHAALAQLPEPLPRIAQAGMEIVLVNTSATKDGLRMIPAGDPRSRKADKLQVRRDASK